MFRTTHIPYALAILAALACTMLVSGCATSRAERETDDWAYPEEPSPVTNGAIYQQGRDVALFENATARHIGDVVMIHLVESTAAQKSSSTNTAKTSKATLPGPTVFGKPVTLHGNSVLSGSLGDDASFAGAGNSKQSNSLVGDLSVSVVKRLPNGNLLVRGQKHIGINQGNEFVRIEGVIRPIDIEPDNSISSSKVANARIAYGAKGALADANRPGLLSRFFNSPFMPF